MGLELNKCRALIKGETSTGKLYLDSKELLFRSGDVRWAVQVGKGTSAKASKGELIVRRGSKTATFAIGAKADKWAEKILNPPSRGTKLGLKPGLRYVLRGGFDKSFESELHSHKLVAASGPKSCDIAFVLMRKSADLSAFDKIAKACDAGVHIWSVWPKGIDEITRSQVIQRGRKHGMGPGKGISFDEICSAMRFTRK